MYLEKLEIQGFKSFAQKNTLIFPGMLNKSKRGITAIVGPNGSGKSNIADAVRWVLGEQSMKALRGKKGEDVIFSGSDKKARLNLAEASLYLNNEDRQAPIDYSQMVLTRRAFRDGTNEYLINNSRTRLVDIQLLLAKANFGQKTYSVIGQGVVEGFLNTSLAERKEFFDEATGVKQFQIKRDESLNKLRLSQENLEQAIMLLQEIEPRLRSLTRQVNRLQKREEIEAELKKLQLTYYGKIWHEINNEFNKVNRQFLELEKAKLEKEKKLEGFNRELEAMRKENGLSQEFTQLQNKLTELQNQKENLNKKLALFEARAEVKFESLGQFDLAWLNAKAKDLNQELEKTEVEAKRLEAETREKSDCAQILNKEKGELDKKINELNRRLIKPHSILEDEELKKINRRFADFVEKLKEMEGESDAINLKRFLREVGEEIKKFLALTKKLEEKEQLEEFRQELIKLTEAKENLTVKINENNLELSAKLERLKLMEEQKEKLKDELAKIKLSLKQGRGKFDPTRLSAEEKEAKNQLEEISRQAEETKEKINDFSKKEEVKRNRLFELQKKLQAVQNETNQLNGHLGELKINSTRLETRLEDLEIEIRRDYGDLKSIRGHQSAGHLNTAEAKEKIISLKRQMDLIGGIDPETEKEYSGTKERFDFLSGQVSDLGKAIVSLEKIIKELDLIIKEKFDREFKIIEKKFEEYFKILFNGGRAKIIKVMESEEEAEAETSAEEETEEKTPAPKNKTAGDFDFKKIKFLQKHNATGLAGIEIQATPPGKKIKSISMLSGGERALTAIALICAIINVNPSPFVVLDEVDAALDEANSERLAKILDDLSYKTQFIIITHNRATMRRANILYGVTMSDDGVSKLLSIKLEEGLAEK